jgi:hypothetical protein
MTQLKFRSELAIKAAKEKEVAETRRSDLAF